MATAYITDSIMKAAETSSTLSVVPHKDAQKMLRGTDSRMMTPPKAKPH
jgi:hypothetical protein